MKDLKEKATRGGLARLAAQRANFALRTGSLIVLFVSGVDLDVRTRVAREMGWRPISESMREAHEEYPSLQRGWPLEYWGLEPFDDSRSDWKIR